MNTVEHCEASILFNGTVYHPDRKGEPHSAIAIQSGRITATGQDDEILSLRNGQTRIYDLSGRFVLPGITDSHIHIEKYSLQLDQVDCDTTTLEECLERIQVKAATTPAGAWIRGHGWNHNKWGGYGNAQQLEKVSPENPVYLSAKSLHAGWVNTSALAKCGIDTETPDPPRGRLQRDGQGTPTGIFFEDAVRLITDCIPRPSKSDLAEAILKGQAQLLRFGITSVHDFDGARCLNALQHLRREGRLVLRVLKHIREDNFDAILESGIATDLGDTQIRIGNLKLFADGALGPQTAAMLRPYDGNNGNQGMLTEDCESILLKGRRAAEAGIGLAVHAIGDRANREVLDALQIVIEERTTAGLRPLPYRIEHLQLLDPVDLPRPGALGIMASMQPIHATSDMDMADMYWGSRVKTSYAWKSQLDAGALLIFGSDAPVESPNPFLGLHAAVTRQRTDGTPGIVGWVPGEKLSLDEALYAYTRAPQKAAGWDSVLGSLTPGYLADLFVLPEDPHVMQSSELAEILPEGVMSGGKWVVGPGWD